MENTNNTNQVNGENIVKSTGDATELPDEYKHISLRVPVSLINAIDEIRTPRGAAGTRRTRSAEMIVIMMESVFGSKK